MAMTLSRRLIQSYSVKGMLFMVLGSIDYIMTFRNFSPYSMNYGRNWVTESVSWSVAVGFNNVEHSLFGKKSLKFLRILFRCSTDSDSPFCSSRAFSRYCCGLIGLPAESSSWSAKSLKIQWKMGKFSFVYHLSCTSLANPTINPSDLTAYSVIFPTLLYSR